MTYRLLYYLLNQSTAYINGCTAFWGMKNSLKIGLVITYIEFELEIMSIDFGLSVRPVIWGDNTRFEMSQALVYICYPLCMLAITWVEPPWNYLPTNFFIFITEGELHIEVIHVWIEDEGEGININDVSYSVFHYTPASCSLYNP